MSVEATPAIEAVGLVRAFGRFHALDGLDLEVRTGEVVGLVGPNGAGKTTFIRTVAGLLRPTAGTIRVFGGTPGGHTSTNVGYMTQSPALYEDLPVRDNLIFFARLFGLSKDDARRRAAEVVQVVELEGRERTPVRDLSGGMRQLTNLACAMVHAPVLLLLDEPTVGIDPLLRLKLWDHFRDLNANGTTIVVTTHVMEEAERCQRVAMMAAGRTIAVDTPAELLRRAGDVGSVEEAYLVFRDRAAQEAGS